jgi:hypothetical protein
MWNVTVKVGEGALHMWLPWSDMPLFPDGYYKELVPVMLVRNHDPADDNIPIIKNQPTDSHVLHLRLSSVLGPAYQEVVMELLGTKLYETLINDDEISVAGRYSFIEGIGEKNLRISRPQRYALMQRIIGNRFAASE